MTRERIIGMAREQQAEAARLDALTGKNLKELEYEI